MKTIIIGLLTLGNIISANASMLEINSSIEDKLSNAQVEEEKTYFETLGNLFKEGTRPDLSKISNIAWAGRCFRDKKPNDPTNAGYIFRQSRASDVGPIGAKNKTYEAFTYWRTDKSTDFFDDKSMEQVFALEPNLKSFPAKINSNSIEVRILDTNTTSKLKVAGDYLIEELSDPASNDVGPLARDGVGVNVRCYYFIPDISK